MGEREFLSHLTRADGTQEPIGAIEIDRGALRTIPDGWQRDLG